MPTIRFTTDGSYDPSNYRDAPNADDTADTVASNGDKLFLYEQGGRYYVSDANGYFSVVAGDNFDPYANNTTDGISFDASDVDVDLALTGGSVGDVLIASSHDDYLNGGGGDDTLSGGGGDDFLIGGDGADMIDGGAGNDTLTFQYAGAGVVVNLATGGTFGDATGDTYTSVENLIGTNYDDVLSGDGSNNVLAGGYGRDSLYSGGGDDTLNGGFGDDTFHVQLAQNGLDTVDGGDGDDRAVLDLYDASFSLSGDANGVYVQESGMIIARLTSVETIVVNVTGNRVLDVFGPDVAVIANGDGGSNFVSANNADSATSITFDGGAGNDMYVAGFGYDRILFSGGGNVIANFSTATITAGGADYTSGAALDGYGGHDNYSSADRLDQVNAGDGDDIIYLNDTGMAVNAGGGTNTIFGGAGNDRIVGGNGINTLHGGAGTDTLSYQDVPGPVSVFLAEGVGRDSAAGDTFDGFENLIGGSGDDHLGGDSGDNVVTGGDGQDTIFYSTGNDVLHGGGQNDAVFFGSYQPGAHQTGVTISLGEAGAQAVGAGSVTLDGFDTLLGSNYDDVLTGNANSNFVEGLNGDDRFRSSGGSDTFSGDDGFDTADYSNQTAGGVTIDLTDFVKTASKADGSIDHLSNIEHLIGTSFADNILGDEQGNDLIEGSGGNDVLNGATGDDILIGGLGADQLFGGGGNDTASYAGSVHNIVASLRTPSDNTFEARGDTYDGIANLTGGTFNDMLRGDGNDNVLTGGAGNDSLIGGNGNDTLIGGDGNDKLFLSDAPVSVDGGAGTDTLSFTAGSIVTVDDGTIAGVERITIGSGAMVDLSAVSATIAPIVMNSVAAGPATLVAGTQGADRVFQGKGSADTISGGGGDDTISVDHAFAAIDGGDGTADRLLVTAGGHITLVDGSLSNVEYVVLQNGASFDASALHSDGLIFQVNTTGSGGKVTGTLGDDRIRGGNDGDTLNGGGGADRLVGGLGADTFSFNGAASAIVAGDAVSDFSHVDGDRIDISAIYGAEGSQAYHFHLVSAFTKSGADEVRISPRDGGNSYVQFDVNHDGKVDFSFLVHSDSALTDSDFITRPVNLAPPAHTDAASVAPAAATAGLAAAFGSMAAGGDLPVELHAAALSAGFGAGPHALSHIDWVLQA